MERQLVPTTGQVTLKKFFESQAVKGKFNELMGKRASAFITSVLQAAMSNELLKNADPASLYGAACIAATLDLPVNPNLGFAYFIPYNDKKTGKQLCQLQLGYKAFIQLAQRSGQFQSLNVSDIREGEIKKIDRLSGEIEFNWIENEAERNKKLVIGYVGYFRLLNGFEKTLFMTTEQLKDHALKYSQTYRKGYGLWKDNFEAMAKKTIIKALLSKYAPLSAEMKNIVEKDVDEQTVQTSEEIQIIDAEVVDAANIKEPADNSVEPGQEKLL